MHPPTQPWQQTPARNVVPNEGTAPSSQLSPANVSLSPGNFFSSPFHDNAIFLRSHLSDVAESENTDREHELSAYYLDSDMFVSPVLESTQVSNESNKHSGQNLNQSISQHNNNCPSNRSNSSSAENKKNETTFPTTFVNHSRGISDLLTAETSLMYTPRRPRSRTDVATKFDTTQPSVAYQPVAVEKEIVMPTPKRSNFGKPGFDMNQHENLQASFDRRNDNGYVTSSLEKPVAPFLASKPSASIPTNMHLRAEGVSDGRATPGGVPLPNEYWTSYRPAYSAVKNTRSVVGSNGSPQKVSIEGVSGRVATDSNIAGVNLRPEAEPFTTSFDSNRQTLLRENDPFWAPSNPSMISGGIQLRNKRNPWNSSKPITAPAEISTPTPLSAKQLAAYIKSGAAEGAATPNRMSYAIGGSHPTPPHIKERSSLPATPDSNGSVMRPDSLVIAMRARGGPTWAELLDNIPFVERARLSEPVNYGVIRVTDIPYDVTRGDITDLLGYSVPTATALKSVEMPSVHIVFERTTGKTNDALIELQTAKSAEDYIYRYEQGQANGTRRKLKGRQVHFKLSSQASLMQEIFPSAKCVRWDGQMPAIVASTESYSIGFQGFVCKEELVMLTKFAEHPVRSRYAHRHVWSVYDSMVSLLVKYPWWAIDKYTWRERDMIFSTTLKLIQILVSQLKRHNGPANCDSNTLSNLLHAGLEAPAFSERQRACLIDATEGKVQVNTFVSNLAPYWPFEFLGCKASTSEQLVFYYAELLKKATTEAAPCSLAERSLQQFRPFPVGPFGKLSVKWPVGCDNITVAQAAMIEWNTLEAVIRQVPCIRT